jgi:3-phosphoshikimate 1-carboxyvinyltransferase
MIKRLVKTVAQVEAPPAKAYTLRAIILSSLAKGTSIIRNPLLGEDQLNLIESLKGLGVTIRKEKNTLTVLGVNGHLKPVKDEIYLGESGVSMNVLSAVVSLSDKPVKITGAEGLLLRPIDEVISGLRQLNCQIEYLDKEGFPPIRVSSQTISGGKTVMSGKKTSQYFSSLALVSPLAQNDVTLVCSDDMSEKPYFDITLEMMSHFGVSVPCDNYKEIFIKANQEYKAQDITIEGDYSSASFFMEAAAICQSEITINGLNKNSKQGDRFFLNYLEEMGCEISWNDTSVTIHGKELKPITVNMMDTPDLVPPLAVTAAFAKGVSTFTGVGNLRFKECNRLEAIVVNLEKMGIKAYYDEDNLYVEGDRSNMHGASIDSYNDHRIAMSFAIAGLTIDKQIVKDKKCVAKSFPDFWDRMEIFY